MFSQPDIEAAKGTDDTIAETDKGEIRGSLEDGVYQYLGIPYAVAKNVLLWQKKWNRGMGLLCKNRSTIRRRLAGVGNL